MEDRRANPNAPLPPDRTEAFSAGGARVAMVSIVGNVALSAFKVASGLIGRSGAMVSDGIHSLSDVFSSIVVIIGMKLAAKAPDRDHPYGHERFECVAAIVLAVVLLITGLFIGVGAVRQIVLQQFDADRIPGVLPLAAAVVSIAAKEAMFWYTRFHAKRLDSGALMADAWHHRSDSLSSVGALIGIAGARRGMPVLDPIAGLVISLFIARAAYHIFRDAVSKMVDRSCSEETQQAIARHAAAQPGVLAVNALQTRVFGNRVYVDLAIRVDRTLPLWQANEIAAQVHDAIEEAFPQIKHIMVHTDPSPKE